MDNEKLIEAYKAVYIDLWYSRTGLYSADKKKLLDQLNKRLNTVSEDERRSVV